MWHPATAKEWTGGSFSPPCGVTCAETYCVPPEAQTSLALSLHWNPRILAHLASPENRVYFSPECLSCLVRRSALPRARRFSWQERPLPEPRYRLLVVCSHPVQYMSPLLRRMAQHPQLDLHVAYCSLRGAQPAHDPDFNATLQWDVPLLEGYSWGQIPNLGSGTETFFGHCNPGLVSLIRKGKYDAVLCYLGYVYDSFWFSWVAARLSGAAFLFGTDSSSLEPRDSRHWQVGLKKQIGRA